MLNLRLTLVVLLALFAGVGGGFLSSRLFASSAKETRSVGLTDEIIVPSTGLVFKTADGKPIAKLASIQTNVGHRNTLFLFNESGNGAVELNALSTGGDVSVYPSREGGAYLSIYATPSGGQLTLMGGPKAAIQMSGSTDGGLLTVNESDGLPAVNLGARAHRGNIESVENTGTESKVRWRSP